MLNTRHYRYNDITKRILSFVGQWPYQKRKAKLFAMTIVTIAALSLNVPQICKFIHCDGNLQCILGTTPSYLLVIMIVVKLYTCQFNSSKIKNLTERLSDDWRRLETLEEYEIMQIYATNGRWLTLLYSLSCFLGCLLFLLIILVPRILDIALPLNESRPISLPYEAYYFVDEREYFFYIFCHSFVAFLIALTGLLAHDCMLLTYMEHVCGVFALAGFRFEHLICKRIDVPVIANNNLHDTFSKKIELCVRTHWMALEFAELLENTFSITFAVQIAIVTIGMSITLVQITLQLNDTIEVIRYIMFVVLQLVHLFVFSFQGQKLIDHSLQIRDQIYNCYWYKIPVKSQKLLLNVMRRSLQPNFLSAGKVYIFSLRSFTTVVQTSVSYFTVLASFQ